MRRIKTRMDVRHTIFAGANGRTTPFFDRSLLPQGEG